MAVMKMTAELITSITAQVRKVYEAKRDQIDMTLPEIVEGFGDYLYQLLLPKAAEKAMLAAMPEWYPRTMISEVTVRMAYKGNSSWRNAPVIYAKFKAPALLTPGLTRHDLPGIAAVTWNGTIMSVVFEEGFSEIPDKYKAFLTKLLAIPAAHDKITKASKEAADTMARFLRQHKTLQSAVKAAGVGLSHYFDYWVKNEYERKPPPRVRKPKEVIEAETVDISKLIAKAAADKLNL